ncbi:MAG: patatin-like phospholipase family protein [Clostridia bacterium]|nr:patatin-like phospholipase family protein [Clostridia bacterium]
MLGIALESGGAKGSYHAGVLKAISELNIQYSALTGSSIGAVNAAFAAQGDIDKLCDFWLNIGFDDLFDPLDKPIVELINGELNSAVLKKLKNTLYSTLKSKGISTARMYNMLCSMIDTDRLINSPVDFGLVAVSFPDIKPLYVFKDQMPPQDVCRYILASATFPGFKLTEIENKKYIDGGAYDCCPINMLIDRGCDEVIAVRVFGSGIFRAPERKDVKVTYIEPSGQLGAILGFSKKQAENNINMGYFDAMRRLKNLAGIKYCIDGFDGEIGYSCISQISDNGIDRLACTMRIKSEKSGRRLLLEEIIPALCQLLKLPDSCSYNDILISALENRALRLNIDRYAIYSLHDFLYRVCSDIPDTSMCHPHPKRAVSSIVDVFLSVLYHAM